MSTDIESNNHQIPDSVPKWASAILDCWFFQLKPTDWYVDNETIDKQITDRFHLLLDAISERTPGRATRDPMIALATIICLDQFPRRIFKKDARAFEYDGQAYYIARNAVIMGMDRKLPAMMRRFVYFPFMHAEDATVQKDSLELFKRLGSEEEVMMASIRLDLINKFSRFPQRNRLLNRKSTAEEIDYLSGENMRDLGVQL